MTKTVSTAANPLRISDLVPLRRMLGTDSVVIRVSPDGGLAPFARMPTLFFERSLRLALTAEDGRFEQACLETVERLTPTIFRPDTTRADEISINPILDDDSDECRFLVCWARQSSALNNSSGDPAWEDLALDQVITRYRVRSDRGSTVIEAAPWWALTNGELRTLWPHHGNVSAMGLGHAVIESLIINAAEAAAEFGGGPAVRISVPSADMLAGLIPVFHGAVRASGLSADRVIVAIDVELAVDPDLLPIIVHLRTMGMQIDIVGLDALTSTLHLVSDTSSHTPPTPAPQAVDAGPWVDSFAAAISTKAA